MNPEDVLARSIRTGVRRALMDFAVYMMLVWCIYLAMNYLTREPSVVGSPTKACVKSALLSVETGNDLIPSTGVSQQI